MNINSKMIKIFGSILLCAAVLVQSAVVFATDKGDIKSTEDKIVGEYVEGEAVVLLNDNADSKYLTKSKAKEAYGEGKVIKSTNTLERKNGKKVRFATIKAKGESTEQLISELSSNSAVKYACPNTIKHKASITNDAYSKFQWALENTGQNGGKAGADTNPESLWPVAASSSKDVVVAVMDSGIDYNHEDLKNILWVNPFNKSKLPGNYGYDFTDEIYDHSPYDNDGHGSHVAGIIAGQADNGIGISGINKSNVKIMSLKILDHEGNGSFSEELDAFSYIENAYNLGVNIRALNCSYGGISNINEKKLYDEIFDALGSYGIVTCIASGNESLNLDNIRTRSAPDYQGSGAYCLPAETESDYALTVAASDERDGVAKFSNIGQCVDIAAPGTSILSTVSYNCFNPSLYTETQLSQICKYYENYENGTPANFGNPNVYFTTTSAIETDTANCFTSHKGMVFKSTASGSGKKKLVFEFPYKIDNLNQEYHISFMVRTKGTTGRLSFDDVSGSFNTASRYQEIKDGWGWNIDSDDSWNFVDVTNESSWLNSTDRKLVFYAEIDGTVAIDDLGISLQGADEDDFGKYDFYPGTSMATPYVAGAAALIANVHPEFSAFNICRAIINTGRNANDFEGKIENAKVLSLDKILNYEPPLEGKTGKCIWSYDENSGTLTISGKGATGAYSYSYNKSTGEHNITTPWKNFASDIKKVVVKNGVTSVGDGCFAGCKALEEVSLPKSLTSIGRYAFFDTNMNSITLPDNIATIRQSALGYVMGYNGSSYNEIFDEMFAFYAYTGSKTAITLKENGFTFKSLGGLTLSKYSATLYVKGTTKIKPVLKNISTSTAYSSSSTKIAKVSSAGKVTAVKKGTATITVKNGSLSQKFKVTVKNPKLNASSKTLKKGKTFKLKITGKVGKATFKSSNKKIATVSSSGKIKAKKKGKATITVKTNGIKLKCKVTVK